MIRISGTNPIRVAQIMGKMVGGGVESTAMNYYRYIDRQKFQFDFIVDADSTIVPQSEIENLGGRVIVIPPYQKPIEYHKELFLLFSQEKYPIVHSYINTLSVFPLFAAKRAGVPVRIAHNQSTAGKGEFARNLMKYTLRPFSKIFATHYCACSNYAGKWLFGKRSFANGEVRVFPNAIDVETFCFSRQIRAEVRRELGLAENLVIGHAGRFVNQKNHRFLIEVFYEIQKQMPNAVLLLAGQGPLENEIRMLVNERGISSCVRFLGQRADLSRLYQAMDLFVFPSFYEGLGIVCVEAQTSGLPCIVSDKVPRETDLYGVLDFYPLSASADDWAREALNLLVRSGERVDCGEQVHAAGYDAVEAAHKMEEYYYSILRQTE